VRGTGFGRSLTWALLFLFSSGALLLCPFVGSGSVDISVVLRPGASDVASTIFWKLRLPRVLQAFVAGVGLAAGGMTFQALFRNPLATPFTLGVASGASLGAVVVIRAGLAGSLLGLSTASAGAFAGALGAVFFVYALSRTRWGLSTSALLLAGVAASFFFSSLILFLQFTTDPFNSFRLLRWVVGGIYAVGGLTGAGAILPPVVVGLLVLWPLCRELDLLSLGEEIAASRGVSVERTKKVLFFVTSLMVAAVVSMCGPIGFVGMMAPHICRLLVGSDHRALLPAACLFGGGFLVACDTVARTVVAPIQLPVGVITAFLGGPFFLVLLLSRSSEPRGF